VQPVAEQGGSDQALLAMVRQLSGEGWECHVAVPGPSPMGQQFAAAGADLHVVAMRRLTLSGGPGRRAAYVLAWPATVARLVRLARRVRADVIHSNSLHSWYGWAAAAVLGLPHIWHAREIVTQSSLALGLERWLARRCAARVIAVSGAVAAQLDPANVIVLTDEPDPTVFGPGRAGTFRRRVGLPDEVPVVGAVGRVDTWKGFDVLLDASRPLRSSRPDVEILVAGPAITGKEAYAAGLEARAASLPGVRWLGPRADVPDLLADLDVFALPSAGPEPYGLVLVEALASGVPVVATAAGGPLEIVAGLGPGAARLVPPGDAQALAAAIADLLPVSSSTDGRRARPRLRAATPPDYAGVFDEVLERSRLPGAHRRWSLHGGRVRVDFCTPGVHKSTRM
jgi:glycosyltransferase involved in cell wall biosynthesis